MKMDCKLILIIVIIPSSYICLGLYLGHLLHIENENVNLLREDMRIEFEEIKNNLKKFDNIF